MFFEVTETGLPIRKRRYVFSETFAAIAMSEYAIASGDHSYAVKALKLFNDIRHFLSTPGILEPKYCERVQMKGHSIIMILINVASRIRAAINDPVLDRQIEESIAILRKDFMHPESVSYTHLDVYKRQVPNRWNCKHSKTINKES